ncbi:MAG: YicC family protein [Bryobacteraceae bacterium]|nr:YicC family protein [Bryobacteraceae bacterium]
MTGFARVRRPAGPDGELVLTLKTVNHRGLDLHFHTPPAIDPFEAALRSQIKTRVARGHVDIRVTVPKSAAGGGLDLNRSMLAAYIDAFQVASREFGLEGKPDLNAAFRIPGMIEDSAGAETDTVLGKALSDAADEALAELNRFREREGGEMAVVIRSHNQDVRNAAAEIERLRGNVLESFQTRLTDRLKELLGASSVDPQRLVQEAAMLADRSDIGEETSRLKIHSAQLDQLMEAGGEVGKKLDFLLQEMNRETNTILSKTNGVGEGGLRITELALGAKAAIEKIREQALNLE